MKILIPLALASALLVTGCASTPSQQTHEQTSALSYQCESGEIITATYPSNNSAKLQYKGSAYAMHIAVSASGARYIGGDLEWWTKGSGSGSEGTLFRHMTDGTSGASIEFCTAL